VAAFPAFVGLMIFLLAAWQLPVDTDPLGRAGSVLGDLFWNGQQPSKPVGSMTFKHQLNQRNSKAELSRRPAEARAYLELGSHGRACEGTAALGQQLQTAAAVRWE
jgi:hypothetical protein